MKKVNDAAYLLVTHGSRDPRPQLAAEHMATLVQQRLQRFASRMVEPVGLGASRWQEEARSAHPPVGTAVLELAEPLHQQVLEFTDLVRGRGYSRVEILPLFLLPGVHVKEDIPAELALSQPHLQDITLVLKPHLGSHPRMSELLTDPLDRSPSAKILLSHGSRRAEGNEPVEKIAQQIGALPAFWSVSPSLEEQVMRLTQQGCQTITIVPYFLFAGGITDAIERLVAELAQQLPYVQLSLKQPIGATPQLADLVAEVLTAH